MYFYITCTLYTILFILNLSGLFIRKKIVLKFSLILLAVSIFSHLMWEISIDNKGPDRVDLLYMLPLIILVLISEVLLFMKSKI